MGETIAGEEESDLVLHREKTGPSFCARRLLCQEGQTERIALTGQIHFP